MSECLPHTICRLCAETLEWTLCGYCFNSIWPGRTTNVFKTQIFVKLKLNTVCFAQNRLFCCSPMPHLPLHSLSVVYLQLLLWSFVLNKCHYFRITKGIVNSKKKKIRNIKNYYCLFSFGNGHSYKSTMASSRYRRIYFYYCVACILAAKFGWEEGAQTTARHRRSSIAYSQTDRIIWLQYWSPFRVNAAQSVSDEYAIII